MVPNRAGSSRDRKQNSRENGNRVHGRSELGDIEREHRSEAPVDELQAEHDGDEQDEVLERQDVAERDAALSLRVSRVKPILFVRRA